MTKAGIPSFVEYGGKDAFEGAKSTGSVGGDVDRGRGNAPNIVDEVALVTGPKTKTEDEIVPIDKPDDYKPTFIETIKNFHLLQNLQPSMVH